MSRSSDSSVKVTGYIDDVDYSYKRPSYIFDLDNLNDTFCVDDENIIKNEYGDGIAIFDLSTTSTTPQTTTSTHLIYFSSTV